jgi:hypothetical protein
VLVFADLASSSSNDLSSSAAWRCERSHLSSSAAWRCERSHLSSSAAWRVLKSGSEGEHSKQAEHARQPTGRSIDGPRDGSLVALCKVICALGALDLT